MTMIVSGILSIILMPPDFFSSTLISFWISDCSLLVYSFELTCGYLALLVLVIFDGSLIILKFVNVPPNLSLT